MGPSQICGCPFCEPRVFEIAQYVYIYTHLHLPMYVKLLLFQELLLATCFSAREQVLYFSAFARVCRC